MKKHLLCLLPLVKKGSEDIMYQFKYLKNKLHLSSFVLNDETLRSGEQCVFTLNPTFLLCNPSKQLITRFL